MAIGRFVADHHYHQQPSPPVNVQALFDWLVREHGYQGSYNRMLPYMRAEFAMHAHQPPGGRFTTAHSFTSG